VYTNKTPQISKAILSKRSNAGGLTKTDYKAIAIKTAWYWHKNRPVEQNRRSRYESTQLCPPDFCQRFQKHTMKKRQRL
jgi:hypothetical protein